MILLLICFLFVCFVVCLVRLLSCLFVVVVVVAAGFCSVVGAVVLLVVVFRFILCTGLLTCPTNNQRLTGSTFFCVLRNLVREVGSTSK